MVGRTKGPQASYFRSWITQAKQYKRASQAIQFQNHFAFHLLMFFVWVLAPEVDEQAKGKNLVLHYLLKMSLHTLEVDIFWTF